MSMTSAIGLLQLSVASVAVTVGFFSILPDDLKVLWLIIGIGRSQMMNIAKLKTWLDNGVKISVKKI